MSEFANYVEYCIEKRPEGLYRQKRIWLRILCILAGLAIIPVVTFSVAGKMFIFFVPVWMGIMGIVYWFLSRFVNIEYEYRIVQGEFQMDTIYGQRQRKKLVDVRVRDMTEIRPYDESCRSKLSVCDIVYDCSISTKNPTPDLYYCLFRDANQKSCAMLFEATRKTLDIMKFYHSSVLVMKDNLRH